MGKRQLGQLQPSELVITILISKMCIRDSAKIERGEASADGFTHSIEGYTREITAELLGCDRLFSHKDSG